MRRLGLFHKLGYARVRLQCLFFPPPPRGGFLPVRFSPRKPHGLVAVGGKLTPETLLFAYSKGVYPFYEEHPIEWLSCDPRMVLFLEKMRMGKGLRPLIQSGRYRVTFDTAFEDVVKACSERDWTWLNPERIAVELALHEAGHAHSVEVWNQEGQLVGGIFGVDLGRMFLSESAFSLENNTMKVACAYLNCHLQHWGYAINDVQAFEEHFRRLGYELIPRRRYIELLREVATPETRRGKWSVDERLDVGKWIPAEPGSQLVS
ncbi:MAG: leucyl/phenylalanyl-tRNA--protein transferase [Pontiellaceae bacterium]|nr:leucyl/phenylalanyl-tRNA--protein transferase [Pontiellaceae bacterium]